MDHLIAADLSASLLLDTLPWGVLVLGADATVQALNRQGAAWWGQPAAVVLGQPLAALAPTGLPPDLYQALRALAAGATLPPAEFFLPATQQWITQTSARQAGQVVVYWQASPARPPAEAAAPAGPEEKYRALFATADEGFAILELLVDAAGQPVDFVYQETNPAFVKHVGRELRGQRRSEVIPERLDFLLEKYATVVATGEPLHLEYELHSLGHQWFQLTVSRIGGAGSRHLGVIFRNVTKRKRREANLAFLADLNVDFAPLLSAEQIMSRVGEQLAEYLHLSRFCLAVVDPEADRLEIIFDWRWEATHLPPRLGEHALSAIVTAAGQQHLGAGRPLVSTGQAPNPLLTNGPEALVSFGFGSLVNIPHLVDGRWRFMLTAARAQPGDWWPDEVELLQQMATRLYARLERARAEAALQAAHAQLVGVLENTSDAFYDLDAGFHYTYVNQRAAQLWGREAGALVGRHHWTEFPQAVGGESYRQHYLVRQTGQPAHYETVSPVLGTWVDVSIYPSQAGGLSVFFKDSTARKQAEERQAFLLQLSDALRLLTSSVDIQATAARVLGQHLGVDRAYYVDIDEAAERYVVIHDWHRLGTPSHARRYPLGDWPMPWLADGQTWVCHDVDTDPTLPEAQRPDYRANDIRAAVVVPLLRQGRLVATLVANQSAPRAWTPQQVALVEETAHRTWAAVERARAEEALARSEEKYRTLFDSIDEGFTTVEVLVDEVDKAVDYRILEMNQAHEKMSGLPRTAVGKRARELMPNIEESRLARLGHVAQTGESIRYEQYVPELGRWFDVYTARVGGPGSRTLANVLTNITARKRYEANLAFLAETSADFAPLASAEDILGRIAGRLADHLQLARCHFAMVDEAADRLEVVYDWRHDAHLPGRLGAARISDYLTAAGRQHYAAGQPAALTAAPPSALVQAPAEVLRALGIGSLLDVPYVQDERWKFLLTVGRAEAGDWRPDEQELIRELAARVYLRLARARSEAALQKSEEQFRLFVTASSDTLYRMSPDWRQMLILEGKNFLADTPKPSTTWAERYLPPAEQARTWAAIQAAIISKSPYELEHRVYRADGTEGWVASRAVPLLDAQGELAEWIGTATDITARKQAQQQLAELNAHLEQLVAERTYELQQNRDLLRSVFDTSLLSMSVLHAVRDEAGRVQDFRINLVNRELERETGRTDLVGKLYAQEYPGVRLTGIYDLMLRTLATGRPQGMEYFYDYEGFNQWFSCQFVRMGDALVATNLDITERKNAEQERIKNLRLLEQAEAVAGLGSWDYELATGAMRWSDGMYQLLGLPLGQPVTPAIYLDHVVDADRPRAEQLVRQLTTGAADAEGILHLRVGGQVKTVRLKAVVLHDEAGQPARVLGVDLDISQLQRLEQENLRLRLSQQQALFEAVQAAQEAERRRIAEGLHNGIGQILYATKLRLDQLRPLPGGAWQPAHREADKLLGEAIRQTRTLSHELVPLVLEEFGLAAALQDICHKMSSPQRRLHCLVQLDAEVAPLAPALQLALYRMAQELAQNIVKHALGATEASLELETMPGAVLLRAEDNGPGFATPPAASTGLGLRSIRDQVTLLGGAMQVGTHPRAGAYVRIRIPLRP
ncbi:PAS domain-containing protein [Hymenobacter bucti]|uniref:PAS domain-containing protein n=1 Tax=Hymenobacter bucti TaxID=1844114 RepID=A0ABW4QNM5_9BACT